MTKQTHIQMIIEWFKARGGTATLREILGSDQPWRHEFNARKTNLRQDTHFDLVLVRGKTPSDNAYTLTEKPLHQPELGVAA